jgi:hypothetical protein
MILQTQAAFEPSACHRFRPRPPVAFLSTIYDAVPVTFPEAAKLSLQSLETLLCNPWSFKDLSVCSRVEPVCQEVYIKLGYVGKRK